MQNNVFSPVRVSRRDVLVGAVTTTLTGALPTFAQPQGERTIPSHEPKQGSINMSTITAKDGTEIFYKDWGPKDARPIVFHHGWPLCADDWDAQMLFFLGKGYRVVAHDRRGHGRSAQVSDGHDMDHYAADVAAVIEHLDLRSTIHIGHSTGGGEAVRYARELLIRVGLEQKIDAYPRQLSGGQQQRVAIARALAIRPKLMLFDEPTSALDPELVGEVLATMRDLANQGLTMIVVTHEIGFAREAADRVVFMDGGHVIETGPPDEVLTNPSHPRTRSFLGRFI